MRPYKYIFTLLMAIFAASCGENEEESFIMNESYPTDYGWMITYDFLDEDNSNGYINMHIAGQVDPSQKTPLENDKPHTIHYVGSYWVHIPYRETSVTAYISFHTPPMQVSRTDTLMVSYDGSGKANIIKAMYNEKEVFILADTMDYRTRYYKFIENYDEGINTAAQSDSYLFLHITEQGAFTTDSHKTRHEISRRATIFLLARRLFSCLVIRPTGRKSVTLFKFSLS